MAGRCFHKHNKNKKQRRDPLFLILKVLLAIIIMVSIGTIGFRIFGENEWIDAFHNGALVFTATTVVEPIYTYNGKIFSGIYNLLSAVFVLTLLAIIFGGAIIESDFTGISEDNNCCCCDPYQDDESESTNVFDTY